MHDIDAVVDQQRQKGLSAATIKRRVAALKVFFDFLAEEKGDLSWPNEAIFLNQHGQPLTANGIEWLLRRYGQAAGIEATPHRLRHTFARQLIEGGMPLTSLGKLLGHAQVSTTEVYTAGADPELAQAY